MKYTTKQAKKHGKLVISLFSTYLKSFALVENYLRKTLFFHAFASMAQNVPEHMQIAVFSIKQIQLTVANIEAKHTTNQEKLQKSLEKNELQNIILSLDSFQSLYQNQNFLSTSTVISRFLPFRKKMCQNAGNLQ